MVTKISNPVVPVVCYEAPTKNYYLERDGVWVKQDRTMITLYLRSQGLSWSQDDKHPLSEVETALLAISSDQYVSYAGRIAGYSEGIYKMFGNRILVTQSPDLIKPVPGAHPLLTQLYEELFGAVQLPHYYGWLHFSLKMFYEEKHKPGQALIMAGPRECGKSLNQDLLTAMFGGTQGQPYQHMSGETSFNADLVEATHLRISDEAIARDAISRAKVGAAIKKYAGESSQRCHSKGVNALEVSTLQRITMSLNNNSHDLLVIPRITDSLEDKVMLFKMNHSKLVRERGGDREEFWKALVAELPAFIHTMLNWKIAGSGAVPCKRMGVAYHHNKELLAALGELENHTRLLHIIDEVLFDSHSKRQEWEGKAVNLQHLLCDDFSAYHKEASQLLRSTVTCGSLLGDLEWEFPDRFSRRMLHGDNVWKIKCPVMKQTPNLSAIPDIIKKFQEDRKATLAALPGPNPKAASTGSSAT